MPKTAIKWNKGLKQLQLAWDPKKMNASLKKHLRRATRINGKYVEAEARKVVQASRGLRRNAPLTVAIKGESKPLVGLTGELFRAITSKAIDDTTVFIGVLKTDASYNIGNIVHNGKTIQVTPEMRGMFFYLWKVSSGDMDPSELTGAAADLWDKMPGGWLPLKESTEAIVIPSRPFIDIAFGTVGLKKRVEDNWRKAIQTAMRERSRGR